MIQLPRKHRGDHRYRNATWPQAVEVTVTEQPAHDLDDEYRLVQNRCGVQQYVLLADLEPIPEGNPS